MNIEATKSPIIVRCSDKQRLSLKNAINQRRDNEPVIWASDNSNIGDMVSTLDTNAPVVFPQLQTQKHMVLNEVFTDLGINNANMDKLIRAIIDIDLDFFRTIDGDFEIVVFASIDNDSMADIIDRMSKDISINEHNEFMPYEIRVSRTGNQISITPINNFVIEYK